MDPSNVMSIHVEGWRVVLIAPVMWQHKDQVDGHWSLGMSSPLSYQLTVRSTEPVLDEINQILDPPATDDTFIERFRHRWKD